MFLSAHIAYDGSRSSCGIRTDIGPVGQQAGPEGAPRFVPPRYLMADLPLRAAEAERAPPRTADPILAPAGVARVPSGANLAPIGSSLHSSRSSSVLDGQAPPVRPHVWSPPLS